MVLMLTLEAVMDVHFRASDVSMNVVKYYNVRTSKNTLKVTESECPRRTVYCQFCYATNEWQFIEGKHKDLCPKFPLACPNFCDILSIPREDLAEHIRVCPLELVRCEFYTIGCTDMMSRRDQKQHNADNLHEHLTLSTCQLAKAKEMVSIKQTIENGLAEIKGEFVQKLNYMEKQLSTLTKVATTQQETISKLTEKLDKLSKTVKDLKPLDRHSPDSSEDEDFKHSTPIKIFKKSKPAFKKW